MPPTRRSMAADYVSGGRSLGASVTSGAASLPAPDAALPEARGQESEAVGRVPCDRRRLGGEACGHRAECESDSRCVASRVSNMNASVPLWVSPDGGDGTLIGRADSATDARPVSGLAENSKSERPSRHRRSRRSGLPRQMTSFKMMVSCTLTSRSCMTARAEGLPEKNIVPPRNAPAVALHDVQRFSSGGRRWHPSQSSTQQDTFSTGT